MIEAINSSVGSPLGTTCSGACACATACEQRRQAYLGRRVTSTRNCAGTSADGQPVPCTDRMRKTLTEAIRLAVAKLLETDPRDLRATDQRADGHPVIVLYDAVAGGAGYTTRLTQEDEFSMERILTEAHAVLDCSNVHCTSSCTQCLNDYSNQKQWLDFDRLPVLTWVETILSQGNVKLPLRGGPPTRAA